MGGFLLSGVSFFQFPFVVLPNTLHTPIVFGSDIMAG